MALSGSHADTCPNGTSASDVHDVLNEIYGTNQQRLTPTHAILPLNSPSLDRVLHSIDRLSDNNSSPFTGISELRSDGSEKRIEHMCIRFYYEIEYGVRDPGLEQLKAGDGIIRKGSSE